MNPHLDMANAYLVQETGHFIGGIRNQDAQEIISVFQAMGYA